VLTVSSLAVPVDLFPLSHPPYSPYPSSVQPLPILRTRRPPRQLEIFDTCTAARTLYPKRNDIFHNAAIDHPKDCLPLAHRPTSARPSCPSSRLAPWFPLRLLERLMYPRLRLCRVKGGPCAGDALSKCIVLLPHF